MSRPYQGLVGFLLGGAIILGWALLLGADLFVPGLAGHAGPGAAGRILLQCWLNVGLFIVAHDAMHGTLVPGRPGVNRAVGRTCLFLYAGFSFDRLRAMHCLHHRHPGTAADPDFNAMAPGRFLPWFWRFLRHYFGWRQFLSLGVASLVLLGLGVGLARLLLFWALPALLSAVQLFTFGTFLPHRHDDRGFADRHNARSQDFPTLLSLLTCFHFGYHHEHHLRPDVPWWGLPQLRRGARRAVRVDG